MSLTAILLVQLPLALAINRLLAQIGLDPQAETAKAVASIAAELERGGYRLNGAVIGKRQVLIAYLDRDGEQGTVQLRRRRNGTLVAPLAR